MRWRSWILALCVGLAACQQGTQGDPGDVPALECSPSEQVVDEALLAFLSKARSVHVSADLVEADDPKAAIAVLTSLVDGPVPGGDDPPPEAREVLADTLARMAELKSANNDFEEARRDIDRGLALATDKTHYRGRLMEVLGVVEQREHKKLLAEGDEDGAAAAKARAIAAFQAAVDIQDEVIQRALGDL